MQVRVVPLVAVAVALILVAWPSSGRAQTEGDNPANLGQRTKTTGCQSVGGLPDPDCTPGAVDPRVTPDTIATTICVPGYTATVRLSTSVTNKIKTDQYAAYGIAGLVPAAAELDHLISLELGGAPADVANLWPELYQQAWGARVKDRVENKLHELVCSGALPLRDAQHAIATDWIAAYHTYVLGDTDPPDLSGATPSEDETVNTTTGADDQPPAAPPTATTAPPPAEKPQNQPAATGGNCSPAYPDFCIPPPPPDLNCTSPGIAGHTNFTVLPPDPHRFDADHDGVGCERRR
jgi:hypothetical protein